MKKLSLLICCLIFASFGFAQSTPESNSESTPTEQTEEKKSPRVKITFGEDDEADSVETEVETASDKKHRRSIMRMGMLDLGISSYLADDSGFNMPDEWSYLDQRLGRSINVGIHAINIKQGLHKRNKPQYLGLSTGVRFNLSHYSFENDFRLNEDQATFRDAIEYRDEQYDKNRLYAAYIALPLLFEINTKPQRESRSFNLAFGYVHNLLLFSNHKIKGGDVEKIKTKDGFNLNKSLGMIEGRVGFGPLNFYVQYGVDRLFKASEPTELTPINIGVNIIPR